LVSDILRSKGSEVATITPDATIRDAVAVLAERRIGAIVVSSDGERIEGIVSERDVVRIIGGAGPAGLDETVGDTCTREVVTVSPAVNLLAVMQLMTERRFRHLPVEVDGRLGGIVSIGDVVKARIGELEDERQALTGYITS
jgi:CBS domain-containing protein